MNDPNDLTMEPDEEMTEHERAAAKPPEAAIVEGILPIVVVLFLGFAGYMGIFVGEIATGMVERNGVPDLVLVPQFVDLLPEFFAAIFVLGSGLMMAADYAARRSRPTE